MKKKNKKNSLYISPYRIQSPPSGSHRCFALLGNPRGRTISWWHVCIFGCKYMREKYPGKDVRVMIQEVEKVCLVGWKRERTQALQYILLGIVYHGIQPSRPFSLLPTIKGVPFAREPLLIYLLNIILGVCVRMCASFYTWSIQTYYYSPSLQYSFCSLCFNSVTIAWIHVRGTKRESLESTL